VGIVVSGGEPLLYYQSPVFKQVLDPTQGWTWAGLETSGYAGDKPLVRSDLWKFLKLFSSVSLSPKVTPCLHGKQSNEQLEKNIPVFIEECPTQMFFKFVVKDQNDVEAVLACEDRNGFMGKFPVYIMPFGNNRDEILKEVEWLIPICARYDWILTPRLQALVWGNERGR
jgi:organic radical activating enzyme